MTVREKWVFPHLKTTWLIWWRHLGAHRSSKIIRINASSQWLICVSNSSQKVDVWLKSNLVKISTNQPIKSLHSSAKSRLMSKQKKVFLMSFQRERNGEKTLHHVISTSRLQPWWIVGRVERLYMDWKMRWWVSRWCRWLRNL